ncbi:glycosyltransferase family 4 protein [Flavobacterium sp. N3904]|uniref:glycosyltransferase family 4 protein n=1 Tax=Flavobacterium sp. N3904 TaxID=2986835 RepID=UPI0022250283|nr:glycosyltransferase [Flavobacterium sp. N3904]
MSSKYVVDICTTGTITRKSQVFDFNKEQKVYEIKALLFHQFFSLKLLAFFSFFKNGRKGKVSDFVNNAFAKRFLDYDEKVKIVLEHLIKDYEAILIVAQLSTGLVGDAIKIAKNINKKILFRTTGTITFSDYDFIESVDCFIHHSQNNAKQIENKRKHKFVIIDQCAYNEIDLLQIPLVNHEVKKFLTLARLEKEKNVDEVIKAFLKVKGDDDVLYVVGDGTEIQNLKKIAKNEKSVIFTGFIKNHDLHQYFSEVDCIIIPYYKFETGPLTGIEAMASARIIISARTGAMPERMKGTMNNFWFDYNNFESFKKVFLEVKSLNEIQINEISKNLKEKYKMEYCLSKIGNDYLKVVSKFLN